MLAMLLDATTAVGGAMFSRQKPWQTTGETCLRDHRLAQIIHTRYVSYTGGRTHSAVSTIIGGHTQSRLLCNYAKLPCKASLTRRRHMAKGIENLWAPPALQPPTPAFPWSTAYGQPLLTSTHRVLLYDGERHTATPPPWMDRFSMLDCSPPERERKTQDHTLLPRTFFFRKHISFLLS